VMMTVPARGVNWGDERLASKRAIEREAHPRIVAPIASIGRERVARRARLRELTSH
jgi:hypothetical protein